MKVLEICMRRQHIASKKGVPQWKKPSPSG
jgi:hypothetical protein